MRGSKIFFMICLLYLTVIYNLNADFSEYRTEQEEAFSSYRFHQDSLFINYKQELETLWLEFIESTPFEWVSYGERFLTRSKVDFQNGKIEIDALIDKDQKKQRELLRKRIHDQLSELMKKDKLGISILSDQILDPLNEMETIDQADLEDITDRLVENPDKQTIIGKDGIKRIKYSVSLDLVPEHIKIRAENYRELIEQNCQRFDMDPALVMAVIHTESCFNPKAYNRKGNAYGLMQIVPKYAGILMNKHLYDKDQEPTSAELFNPEINLAMGIGYLRWLEDNIWRDVIDQINKYYCLICSYNGGPGSVYKALTGKIKGLTDAERERMIDKLNGLKENELYDLLLVNLPYKETMNYLRTVLERMNSIYKN